MKYTVCAKHDFGGDFVELTHFYHIPKTQKAPEKVPESQIFSSLEEIKEACLAYIRSYRAGNKRVEFKIVDEDRKEVF